LERQPYPASKPGNDGDTNYPALEVTRLVPGRATGVVILRSTVHNLRRELAPEGVQKFSIRRKRGEPAPGGTKTSSNRPFALSVRLSMICAQRRFVCYEPGVHAPCGRPYTTIRSCNCRCMRVWWHTMRCPTCRH